MFVVCCLGRRSIPRRLPSNDDRLRTGRDDHLRLQERQQTLGQQCRRSDRNQRRNPTSLSRHHPSSSRKRHRGRHRQQNRNQIPGRNPEDAAEDGGRSFERNHSEIGAPGANGTTGTDDKI